MTLEEAKYWRDEFFRPWYGNQFPVTGALLCRALVLPAREEQHPFYFTLLDEILFLEGLLPNGCNPDDEALGRLGIWNPDDRFQILLEFRYEGNESRVFRMPAYEFLALEGIEVKPDGVFAG